MKLKAKDISVYRERIAQLQDNRCWICKIDLRCVTATLDHSHQTGRVRGCLCANCNGLEGRVFSYARRGKRQRTEAEFITSLLAYWKHFEEHPRSEIHPTHKTKDEKRIRRNKKARERRNKVDSK